MKTLKSTTAALALLAAIAAPTTSQAAEVTSKGKVLIVMSGAHLLPLQESKVYATGYYLNELATPLKAIVDAGYTPVFASPDGNAPWMDASSDNVKFFGNDDAKRMDTLKFVDSFDGLRHPLKLSQIVGHTQNYVGIFVPGGHAPMVDLASDRDLGKILVGFHNSRRPTALLCHGPMALLSTPPQTVAFNKALNDGETAALPALSKGWPYAGYKVTAFSKAEEQQIEEPQLDGHTLL